MRDDMDRMSMKLSLDCWCCEARSEFLDIPLRAATLPSEIPTLSVRETWDGVRGPITIGFEVAGTLDWSSTWGGYGGSTIAGSAVIG